MDTPSRTSSCAKVEHEAGIVHDDAPETRRAEPDAGEIFLDFRSNSLSIVTDSLYIVLLMFHIHAALV